ncbi:MAG: hypothetical protein RL549_31 [Verrucomicrobiota bacterium]
MPKPSPKNKKSVAKKADPVKKSHAKKAAPKKKAESSGVSIPRLRESPLPVDQSAHKFVLQPFTPAEPQPELPAYEYLGELPESYGTRRLFLTARDPRWLYAYWDFSWQQLRDAEQESPEGKVFLQIYVPGAERVHQIQVFPGAKEWYLPVHRPATLFQAELGYYRHDGSFHRLAVSDEVLTPRDDPSPNREVEFVTIPFHYSFRQLLELIRDQMRPGEGLAKALARLQREGYPLPFPYALRRIVPSGLADRMLEYLGGDLVRRIRVGSLEITETLRRRLLELGSSGIPSSLSSGPRGQERSFSMHVNAELIIYGGTVPGAKVTVDGREIHLRPDGTFSYHFTFPNGRFHIPISASAPDGLEERSVLLSFLRLTDSTPGVDPTSQPPLPEPLGRMA